MTEDHPRFVTIDFFVKEMMGYKSRISYYNHRHDDGFPQRVYPGGKPMLVYAECVDYLERVMARRAKKGAAGGKRHVGRPAGPAKEA